MTAGFSLLESFFSLGIYSEAHRRGINPRLKAKVR